MKRKHLGSRFEDFLADEGVRGPDASLGLIPVDDEDGQRLDLRDLNVRP